MQAWRGWTAVAQTAVKTAPTWEEWCAYQRRLAQRRLQPRFDLRQHACQHDNESSPFSERELARLSFVRWLYQTGHLDPARTTTTERKGV
jgi:hypothetical protein